jgi:hypothetical protein
MLISERHIRVIPSCALGEYNGAMIFPSLQALIPILKNSKISNLLDAINLSLTGKH